MAKTLTSLIYECSCPWDNVYQGQDKKVLFVCSAGILRSATAARIYAKKWNTRACGSYPFALIPLTTNLFVWADMVVFVNQENFNQVKDLFPWDEKEHFILDIPDMYKHMDPKLIEHFKVQFADVE